MTCPGDRPASAPGCAIGAGGSALPSMSWGLNDTPRWEGCRKPALTPQSPGKLDHGQSISSVPGGRVGGDSGCSLTVGTLHCLLLGRYWPGYAGSRNPMHYFWNTLQHSGCIKCSVAKVKRHMTALTMKLCPAPRPPRLGRGEEPDLGGELGLLSALPHLRAPGRSQH